jgi:pantetheine-phosphate adenylyltransferase
MIADLITEIVTAKRTVSKNIFVEEEVPMQAKKHGKFKGVILSGTFSPIHIGHARLFDTAFNIGEKVFIGLTTDTLAQRKNPPPESYKIRKERLLRFLKSRGISEQRYEIIPIDDVFGFSLNSELPLDAIVATKETAQNVEEINLERRKKGLNGLKPVIVELVTDKNGEKISSRKLRAKKQDPSYIAKK